VRNPHFQEVDHVKNAKQPLGGAFATEITLGGRLYSVESLIAVTEAQILERKNEMRWGLTANIMNPMAGGGFGGHRSSGSETGTNFARSSGIRGTSIEAHGGDSLLSYRFGYSQIFFLCSSLMRYRVQPSGVGKIRQRHKDWRAIRVRAYTLYRIGGS
jgi:hypothetical protein